MLAELELNRVFTRMILVYQGTGKSSRYTGTCFFPVAWWRYYFACTLIKVIGVLGDLCAEGLFKCYEKVLKIFVSQEQHFFYDNYTWGDSDVISSYHIYASCFSAML